MGDVNTPFGPLIADFNRDDRITAGSIAGFVHGTEKINRTAGFRHTRDWRDHTFDRTANTPGAALIAAANGLTSRCGRRSPRDGRRLEAVMDFECLIGLE